MIATWQLRAMREQGMTNAEIAKELGLNVSTVRRNIGADGSQSRIATEDVILLRESGYTIGQIAKELGFNARTVERHIPDDLKTHAYHPPLAPELLAKALPLLEDRAGYAEAARTVGCDVKTLARHFPNLGLDDDERIERWTLAKTLGHVLN